MWLVSDGQRGECHPLYLLHLASKYWGVPPWELLERPVEWLDSALAFMEAEGWAQTEKDKRRNRNRNRKRKR